MERVNVKQSTSFKKFGMQEIQTSYLNINQFDKIKNKD
jgi:hypothetical protein